MQKDCNLKHWFHETMVLEKLRQIGYYLLKFKTIEWRHVNFICRSSTQEMAESTLSAEADRRIIPSSEVSDEIRPKTEALEGSQSEVESETADRRSAFGNRLLADPQDVFKHNAWYNCF